jgi:hypothetical protein
MTGMELEGSWRPTGLCGVGAGDRGPNRPVMGARGEGGSDGVI